MGRRGPGQPRAEERAAIARELAQGVGLGGRARRTGGAAERARTNVQRRIRGAIRKIGESIPALGAYLDRTVRTGTFCATSPSGAQSDEEHCSSPSHAPDGGDDRGWTRRVRRSARPARLGALWAAAWQSVPEAIARMLAAGGSALEVGCGSGLACLALAEASAGAHVIGHDADPQAIARARALALAAGLEGPGEFRRRRFDALPRATFHLVTAEELRAAPAEPRRVLNAIRNALVPDGACLLLEPPRPLPTRVPDIDLQSLAWQTGFSRFRPVPSEGPLRLFELRR